MLQRIDIGDSEGIGNQGTSGRSAAGTDRNLVLFGVANEVPYDEEISRELHLLDDGEFALKALFVVRDGMLELALIVLRTQRSQAARKAFPGNVNEIAVDGVAGGNIELRERGRHFFEAETAALGDIEGARQDLG